MKCAHCYNSSGKGSDLDVNLIYYLISVIQTECEQGEKYKIAISGGEPLLREDIKEILHRLIKIPNLEVTLLTNGLFLEKIMSDFLFVKKPIKVHISLDGATAETNDFIRGKGLRNLLKRSIITCK